MALTFKITANRKPVAVQDTTRLPLYLVKSGAQVTMTISAAAALDASATTWTRDGEDWPVPASRMLSDGGGVSIPLEAKDWPAVFAVTAGGESARAIIAVDPPPSTVVETALGEFDPQFAIGTLIVSLALLLAIGILVTAGPWHTLPVGSFGQSAVAQLALLGVVCGVVLLIFGGLLAALEVRGRLRKKDAGDKLSAKGVPAADLGSAVSDVVGALTNARGTIVVLVLGGIVLCFSIGAMAWTVGPPPSPQPSTIPPPAPTQSLR